MELLNVIASILAIAANIIQIFVIFKTSRQHKAEINILIKQEQEKKIIISNPNTNSDEHIKLLLFTVLIILFGIIYFAFFEIVFLVIVAFYVSLTFFQTKKILLISKVNILNFKQLHLITFALNKLILLLIVLSIAYLPFDMKQFILTMLPKECTFNQFSTILNWFGTAGLYLFQQFLDYDYRAFYFLFRAVGIIMLLITIVKTSLSKATMEYLNVKKVFLDNLIIYFFILVFLHSNFIFPYIQHLIDFLNS